MYFISSNYAVVQENAKLLSSIVFLFCVDIVKQTGKPCRKVFTCAKVYIAVSCLLSKPLSLHYLPSQNVKLNTGPALTVCAFTTSMQRELCSP